MEYNDQPDLLAFLQEQEQLRLPTMDFNAHTLSATGGNVTGSSPHSDTSTLIELEKLKNFTDVSTEHINNIITSNNNTGSLLLLSSNDDQPVSKEEELEKKRKQNRMAQKAFRERKEAKIKELQNRLATTQEDNEKLMNEIKVLKEFNLKINFENNKLLLKQKEIQNNTCGMTTDQYDTKFSFPTQDQFFANMLNGTVRDQSNLKSVDYMDSDGNRLLTIPAVWEYLNSLTNYFDIDIPNVMENLKGHEQCNGFGAAYKKSLIDRLVQEALEQF
ncbi:hypothetical protein KAFR_0D03420 [Kazachstania africana CBS 2517]|uniref:BZIP domain-containing protein n=1 Tax=Kazachstania africana (strain ATCC 22294 / BCRC 22015 / CBS 2517 / CECT 1963 / NBRC 1671 / NRRL Y-8276) TaxID=1071382 RepID=H2AUE0_KAZAF|nr:hypothetical protein KAFR_0D03420 [Kazachstania africana CBS 2517]CCF57990.1 hypothetical protein KAFR_0D03420 [Kazachstania africana CBS 2517]